MQRSTVWLRVLLLPLDLLAIGLAIVLAYSFRTGDAVQPSLFYFARTSGLVLPLKTYLLLYIASWPVWIIVFAERGLYDLRAQRTILDEFGRVVLAVSIGLTLSLSLLFVTHIVDVSRVVILQAWWISIMLVFLVRLAVRLAEQLFWTNNIGTLSVAFLGSGRAATELKHLLRADHDRPWRYSGHIGQSGSGVLGRITDLPRLASVGKIDELWVLDSERRHDEEVANAIALATTSGLTVRLLPQRFDLLSQELVHEDVLGLPLLRIRRTPLEGWGRVVKRVVDVLISTILLIILSPLLLLIALGVKLDSVGPTIFRQRRVGEQGRQFWFYKFRTMENGAEKKHAELLKQHGNMFKLKDDPRQTRFGRFLRKTSLDELPQLWNVLRGDMSLVGPRPPLPIEVEQYSPEERRRLGVKPGMTGLWQVSGRSDTSFADWVELDAYYIEHWSLWLDITIMLRTILVVFGARGAY